MPAGHETTDDPGSEETIEVPGVWFFLPLPHPLGLPAGWRSERPQPMVDILRAELQGHHLASSLLIHQLVPSVQPVLANMTDLWSMAAAAMGNKGATANSVRLDHVDGELGDLSGLHAVTTVAEVAVPGCDGATEEAVSHALDEAVEHVRFVNPSIAWRQRPRSRRSSARSVRL